MAASRPTPQFITETAFCKIRDGVKFDETNSEPLLRLSRACKIIETQPGFVRFFWGIEHEDPCLFVFSIDWISIRYHQQFNRTNAYNGFVSELNHFLDFESVKPLIFHTSFPIDSIKARLAPVTEDLFLNIASDSSKEHKAAFETNVRRVAEFCASKGNAFCHSFGWVHEKMDNDKDASGEALAFNVMIGWPSIEDHMKVARDPEFQQVRQELVKLCLPVTIVKPMRHVQFRPRPIDKEQLLAVPSRTLRKKKSWSEMVVGLAGSAVSTVSSTFTPMLWPRATVEVSQ